MYVFLRSCNKCESFSRWSLHIGIITGRPYKVIGQGQRRALEPVRILVEAIVDLTDTNTQTHIINELLVNMTYNFFNK